MSITDELREWAEDNTLRDRVLTTYPPQHAVHGVLETLLRIADRIDAEHVAALKSLGMAQAERDEYLESCRLWEFKCDSMMELPRDADGEPIHVGDVMEWVRYKDDDPTIMRTVSGIGNSVFFAWSDEQGRYAQYEAHAYRHHHVPTVEDVLDEFASAYDRIGGEDEEHQKYLNLIAEYAAKLRLAGDA